MFENIIEKISNRPDIFGSDYKAGDLKAIIQQIGCEISVCYFSQSIRRHIQKEGLNTVYSADLECRMRSTQTRFRHPKSRTWTKSRTGHGHRHATGTKAQLDHILINGKWLNSIKNVRAYNTVELKSDHRIVTASLAISLRAPKTKAQKRMKYDWNKLKLDTALQAQFNI